MKNLNEYNKEQYAARMAGPLPRANGLACPNCGAELWDTNPGVILLSSPPKIKVHCPSCGYSGYKVA